VIGASTAGVGSTGVAIEGSTAAGAIGGVSNAPPARGASSTAVSISEASAAREARPGILGIVIGSGTGAIGRTAVGGSEGRGAEAGGAAIAPVGAAMEITPPQTEHRARTPTVGTFDGSTRNTDRHSGHETFTAAPPTR
jgi:hypothetical protein